MVDIEAEGFDKGLEFFLSGGGRVDFKWLVMLIDREDTDEHWKI